MAKTMHNNMLDAVWNYVKNSVDTITYTLNSSAPTNRTEAVTTYALAQTTLNKATDLTLADGDTNGRKCTISAKTGLSVTANGTATHVSICDASDLLVVTSTTSQAVSSGGTVDIGSWKDEIADPA
jgi:hypothetical protein